METNPDLLFLQTLRAHWIDQVDPWHCEQSPFGQWDIRATKWDKTTYKVATTPDEESAIYIVQLQQIIPELVNAAEAALKLADEWEERHDQAQQDLYKALAGEL